MKLNSIQFLRALAAILVVYAHSIDLTTGFAKSHQRSFYHLSNLGFAGVDIFFVISGFLITLVASQYTGLEQGSHFLKKRFIRVNPIYYIASLLFLGSIILQAWVTQKSFPLTKPNLINSILDTLIILPVDWKLLAYKPLLMIGWTLSFGWLFYILFFLTILTKLRQKILLLFPIISVLVSIRYMIPHTDFRLMLFTNPMLLEFLLGIIICHVYLQKTNIHSLIPPSLLIMGIGWFIFLIFQGYGKIWSIGHILNGFLSMQRFLLWGIPSSFLIAGCVLLEKNEKLVGLWNNKWSILIGDASYAIYLIHLTVFTLFKILYKQTGFFLPADLSIWIQLLIAIIACTAFYKWIEYPLLKYLRRPAINQLALN